MPQKKLRGFYANRFEFLTVMRRFGRFFDAVSFAVVAIAVDEVCLAGSFRPSGVGGNLVSQTAYFTNGEYTSTSTSGVTVNGATLARGTLTGTRAEGTTPFEFQSFAGWLNGSIFGTTQIEFGASGSEQYRFISYLTGVPATNNPSASGSETSATWNGTTVASIKADRTFILGDATVTIPDFTNADVDVTLDNWRGLDNQAVSGMSAIIYRDLDLAGGSFVPNNANEQISGRFYGTGHTEVGGFFNTETVTGAFGGTRQ